MNKGRILCIEDDEAIRELFAAVLVREGFEVAVEESGLQALQWLQKSRLPNLILLDLMMPVMDGWQVLGELAREPKLFLIPVVVVSAISELTPRVFPTNVKRTLTKPIRLDTLIKTVHETADELSPSGSQWGLPRNLP